MERMRLDHSISNEPKRSMITLSFAFSGRLENCVLDLQYRKQEVALKIRRSDSCLCPHHLIIGEQPKLFGPFGYFYLPSATSHSAHGDPPLFDDYSCGVMIDVCDYQRSA